MGKHYEAMMVRAKEANDLGKVGSLLGWDQETNMPPKGSASRGRQLSILSGLAHERFTSREMEAAIRGAEGETLTGHQGVNLREIRRAYDRAVKIPGDLVRDMAETSSAAKEHWRIARAENDFPRFAPWLAKTVELKKRYAEAVGYETEPYDALLDDYEQGATASELSRIFGGLRERLVPLVAKIRAARAPRSDFLRRRYRRAGQETIARRLLELMGFDFEAGRVDVSTHPFTTSFSARDVRLTTRFDESFLNTALFGTMHEGGHALYEQGLPPEHECTPAGESVSLGIHESQSRLWENMIGRSRPFWAFFFPVLHETFPDALQDVTTEEFYRAVNEAKPSLIRVEADEVFYNLHIMLRFELERDLFRGAIQPEELPGLWNQKMEEYVGIRPTSDAEGCLQDIHWAMGLMGYFPTYSLGNLYAAQIMVAARRAIPDLDQRTARGEFQELLRWLRQNIHSQGMTWRPKELIERVTGEPPDSKCFLDYLEAKYTDIYGL